MAELKVCPFCGGKAEIVEYSDGSGHIECASCGFEAMAMFSWGSIKSRKAEAIATWNRRADDAELARYKQLEADGLLVALPCRVGDEIYSLNWSIKNEKYELYTSKIKNVRFDSADGLITVSDGERFRVLGKTTFLTREAAQAALEGAGG